jgi:hypothetical protein
MHTNAIQLISMPRTAIIHLRVSPELKSEAQKEAEHQRLSLTRWIEILVGNALAKAEKRTQKRGK